MTIPVVIVSSIDPVSRDTAIFGAVSDLPGTGVLQQDLDAASGSLRRVISDETGVLEERVTLLEHACLGCAIREDSLPTLEAMAASGRWQRILWALPVGADTPPAARPLADPENAGRMEVELAAVIALLDTDTAVADLMGDDLLDERGLALAEDDRRSVGETLAGQLRHADLVLVTGDNPVGTALVDLLRGRGSRRRNLFETPGEELVQRRYSHSRAEARIDPRSPVLPDAIGGAGAWSWTLSSDRPFHPDRFLDRLDELVVPDVLSHGCFRVAGRPDQVGEWDGAGSQLSIGDGGDWHPFTPVTRLRFVGTGPRPTGLEQVFRELLLTDEEMADRDRYLHTDDGLEPWLGERTAVI
ncbi:cobalamin biosynthesis protein CobW [Nakamurella sp. YIM 132087]|uniref:Cobalamin biosynthesis protein CobW n=1 Tax=Nakamurella alba TaxID=2665158 RepID=A0A7K1FRF6_9ACTN|nr:GTP-binding protein [Nakamurella alba]MTD16731.1 cobalamin biosynthesis protein CobW [Nakamurella alba]